MAGAGRRSQYRKHLTDSVMNDFPEPRENEWIARVVATRGGNQFDIELPPLLTSTLAILPTKFHKLVWVKRNDFVIVEGGGDDDDERSGIRYSIKHILYKEQIKHLRAKNLWPKEFFDVNEEDHEQENERLDKEGDDGIMYDQGYELGDDQLDDIMVNTNRVVKSQPDQESESESDGE